MKKSKEMKENDMECCMAEVGGIEQYWIRMEMWTKTDHEGQRQSYMPCYNLQT